MFEHECPHPPLEICRITKVKWKLWIVEDPGVKVDGGLYWMVGPSTTLQAWYTLVVPSTEAGPESTDRTNPDQTRDKSCSLESWWKKMKLDRRQNLPMPFRLLPLQTQFSSSLHSHQSFSFGGQGKTWTTVTWRGHIGCQIGCRIRCQNGCRIGCWIVCQNQIGCRI